MSLPQCFWSEISQRVSVVFAPGPGHSSVRLILLPFSPLSPPSIHLCPLSLLPPSHSNSHWRRHLDLNKFGDCAIALRESHCLVPVCCIEDSRQAHRADSPGCVTTKWEVMLMQCNGKINMHGHEPNCRDSPPQRDFDSSHAEFCEDSCGLLRMSCPDM